jgi:hypothetical protein
MAVRSAATCLEVRLVEGIARWLQETGRGSRFGRVALTVLRVFAFLDGLSSVSASLVVAFRLRPRFCGGFQ